MLCSNFFDEEDPMRSETENIRICGLEESLCIVNLQDSHVSFRIYEPYNRYRSIEPVVTKAGSFEIMVAFNFPKHIFKHQTGTRVY